MKYWPHYQHEDGEEDLCAQFEHRLKLEIRAAVSVFHLIDLPTLVSKYRIFEANLKGKTVDTRGSGPMRYGGPHMLRDCPQPQTNYGNCGKLGYTANVCWATKKSGSMSTTQRPGPRGSTESSRGQSQDRLLDVLFDSGATHSFISMDCAKCLGLYVKELSCNVVVTTPTGKPVVTLWVCLGYSIMMYRRNFEVNLICSPFFQLDVLMRIYWLVANHVLLDCRKNTLIFGTLTLEILRLLSQGAWENTMNAKAFMVMFSMEAESIVEPEYIPVVRDFLEVFPEEVSKLPPEKEIEFVINLIPGASSISVAP
ncbi:uncharacterized protein LOC113862266 [Abrus precatorius]|uniref:Uncharacterized protein LOC113862266 n=1 Tax=Abrus precatorius TaxID=3816 RepID=A0A8B8L8U4_ABRPR|nr:uncharacterized protein LOC113862266 [Abrus precatorius]